MADQVYPTTPYAARRRLYSPAPADPLIRPLYYLAQARGMPMTALASLAVREYLTTHATELPAGVAVPAESKP